MELNFSESKAKEGVGGWADGQLLDSSFGRHMGLTQSCFDQGIQSKEHHRMRSTTLKCCHCNLVKLYNSGRLYD